MKAIGVLLCCVAAAHCAVYFEEKFDGAAAALIAAPCATVQMVWLVEAKHRLYGAFQWLIDLAS